MVENKHRNYDSQVQSEEGRQELKEGSVTVNKKTA